MPDDLNLYPLHVFRLVARLGSVTHAARELKVSQPAVSAHLRALEARYAAPLFERTPRGMRLTPAGEVVADHAARVFALLDDMGAAVESASGQIRGAVTVAASTTPGAYLLPGLLRAFRDSNPRVEPELVVGDSAEALAWVMDYRAPLGVVGEAAMDEALAREEIAADELRLVTAADDMLCRVLPIRDEYLRERTLLLRERGSSTRAGAERVLGDRLHAFGRVVEMASADAVKQSVAAGLGVAVLSSWATRLEEQAGLLRPVRDERYRCRRRFYLVRRADRDLVGAAGALWEFLRRGMRDEG